MWLPETRQVNYIFGRLPEDGLLNFQMLRSAMFFRIRKIVLNFTKMTPRTMEKHLEHTKAILLRQIKRQWSVLKNIFLQRWLSGKLYLEQGISEAWQICLPRYRLSKSGNYILTRREQVILLTAHTSGDPLTKHCTP